MKISKIEYKLFYSSKNLRKIKTIKSTVDPRIKVCKINVYRKKYLAIVKTVLKTNK